MKFFVCFGAVSFDDTSQQFARVVPSTSHSQTDTAAVAVTKLQMLYINYFLSLPMPLAANSNTFQRTN